MNKHLETFLFWLVVAAVVGLVHWGLSFLVPYLFNHGSSSAFELGIAVVIIDGIFWCYMIACGLGVFQKRRKKNG